MNTSANSFLRLRTQKRKTLKIRFQDIIYLEGNINYTLIHLADGNVKLSPRTLLYHVRNSLNDSFLRIHRAFCVNKDYIQSSSVAKQGGSSHIQLTNGLQLAVARRRKKVLSDIE